MKDGQILGRQIALLKDSIETGMLLCWQIIDNVFNTCRLLSIFINLDHELNCYIIDTIRRQENIDTI